MFSDMAKLNLKQMPIFRSDGQAAILAVLFLDPAVELSLSQLAAETGLSIASVHDEVERLEQAGLVLSRRIGRNRMVSANLDSPIADEIGSLIRKLFGVEPVLKAELQGIPGIEEAFIFGSWAARRTGLAGPVPADIDVMVIGDVNLDEVYHACRVAEEVAHLPVNPTIYTQAEWDSDSSGFVAAVRSGPVIRLVPDQS